MTKHKLVIELPSPDDILAGLDKRELHPELPRAEQAAAQAEQDLVDERGKLEAARKRAEALVAEVADGRASMDELVRARAEVDVLPVVLKRREQAAAQAREQLAAVEKAARSAYRAEIKRRAAALVKAAGELAPVLAELQVLESCLAQAQPEPTAGLGVSWPAPIAILIKAKLTGAIGAVPLLPAAVADRARAALDKWRGWSSKAQAEKNAQARADLERQREERDEKRRQEHKREIELSRAAAMSAPPMTDDGFHW